MLSTTILLNQWSSIVQLRNLLFSIFVTDTSLTVTSPKLYLGVTPVVSVSCPLCIVSAPNVREHGSGRVVRGCLVKESNRLFTDVNDLGE